MNDDTERILGYRRQIEVMQRERDKLAGMEEQLRKQAKKEFGASTDSELKAIVAKEEKQEAKKRAELMVKEKEFLAKYGELLGEESD